MGTKLKPGKFDCYANAEPDEPMFVLLARDKHAPVLVWLWSLLRETEGESPEKVQEAVDCASAMVDYQRKHGRLTANAAQCLVTAIKELIPEDAKSGDLFLISPKPLTKNVAG